MRNRCLVVKVRAACGNSIRLFLSLLLVGLIAFADAAGAAPPAQAYPERPVRIIVPFPAGGATDVAARILANELTAKFKQTFLIENRGGAAGTIGIDLVAKSNPDGYTLGVSGAGPTAIFPILDPRLPYSPSRDLDMIAGLSAVDYLILARLGFPPSNITELIDYARANPGKVTYGTPGVGGPAHLQMESLALSGGIKMLHVPFTGDAPIVTALLSGDVDIAYVTVASGEQSVIEGALKALGKGGPTRLKALPDTLTLIEQTGFKEITGYSWAVLVAAKGTPPDVLEKLNTAVNEILTRPEMIEKLANVGIRTMPGDVKTITDFVASEAGYYRRVIEQTGIKRE